MTNIVFFGPENVGKSTMIGYIYCKSLDQEQYNQEIERIKYKMGSGFQQDRLYSYFLDRAKDEREKQIQNKKETHGTSKYAHLKATLTNKGKEILFIDTPGAPEYLQQKIQGVSMASIGVFAIEVKQLTSRSDTNETIAYNNFNKFFSTWFLWKKMSGLKKSIIILTKYDQCDGESDIKEAESNLAMLLGDDIKETIIIPTSVTAETDINVTTKMSDDWYKGPCLMDALVEKCKVVEKENSDMPLLMFHIKNHKEYNQSSLSQWKILQGMISSRDRVKIAPVELNDKSARGVNKYTSVEATIDSISPYNANYRDDCYDENAYSGSVNDIMLNIIGRANCSISPTAIAVKPDEELSIGSCMELELRKDNCTEEEWLEILKIYPQKQLSVLWFSRIVNVRAEESSCIQPDLYRLRLSIDGNGKFALPNRKVQQQMIMLRIQLDHIIDGKSTKLTTAVRARVLDIN